MELALRDDVRSASEVYQETGFDLLQYLYRIPFLVLALHAVSITPPVITVGISLLVAVGAIVIDVIRNQQVRLWYAITWLFGAPVCTAIGAAFIFTLRVRPFSAGLLAAFSLWAIYDMDSKAHPYTFCREYLFAAGHLAPETRRNRDAILEMNPLLNIAALLMVAVVFYLVVFYAAHSPVYAIAALYFLAMCFNLWMPRRTWELAKEFIPRHLDYGRNYSGAPGVWVPGEHRFYRRFSLFATVLMFYVALSTGLYLYFPIDYAPPVEQAESAQQQQQQPSPTPTATPAAIANGRKPGRDDAQLIKITPPLPPSQSGPKRPVFWAEAFPAAFSQNVFTHKRLIDFAKYVWKTRDFDLRILVLYVLFPLLVSFTLPPLLLLGLCRPFLGHLKRLEKEIDQMDRDGRTPWQCYVDKLSHSHHAATGPLGETIKEADHLFLGVEPAKKFPILIHRKILAEHCYISGATGSGKTSLGIIPIVTQLISGKAGSEPSPMVIMDLKGDMALLETARRQAEKRGQKFLLFTLEQNKRTCLFNPFQGFESEHRTLSQLCNLFLDALGLNHGEGYGKGYYSRQARMTLFDALNDYTAPRTFPDLFKVVYDKSRSGGRYQDAFELLAVIHALKQYPQLITGDENHVAPDEENTIHMPRVLEENQVVYFWLPASIESISVREIAKLALFCLLSAAHDRNLERKAKKQTYLVIDEFQRIAGENLKIVLEQARSFGVGAILSNQAPNDLKLRDWDLRSAIRTNTRMQLTFTMTDPAEVIAFSDFSGEEAIRALSITDSTGSGGSMWRRQRQEMHAEGWKVERKNRLTVNDIARVSDDPLEYFGYVSRGEGYTQFAGLPFPVRGVWSTTLAEYEEMQAAPWPELGVIVNPNKSPVARDTAAHAEARQEQNEVLSAYQERLGKLFDEAE